MSTNYNQVDWYRRFNMSIGAGEIRNINKLGRYITILSSTGGVEDLTLSINGQESGVIEQGISLELPPTEVFDKMALKNTNTTSAVDVVVIISNGLIHDARKQVSGAIEIDGFTSFNGLSDGSVSSGATEIVAADSTRKEIFITNNSATADLYLGDATVNAGKKGVIVKAGQTVILSTGASIYAIASTGTVSYSLAEMK